MTVTSEYAAQHLDALLRAIAAGEEVLITVNGVAVAKLVGVCERTGSGEPSHVETPVEEVEQAFHGD